MKNCYLLLFLTLLTGRVVAQPTGWSGYQTFTVTNNSSNLVLGYQMPVIVNTQTLIASNQMQASGNDARFGTVCNVGTYLPHYLDSGINTANTRFFVQIDTLLPNGTKTIYFFYGNPTAPSTSTLSIFNGPYSSTNQITGGTINPVVANSQRGFRFAPNSDILVTQFGKLEPTGTTRYVTLFDMTTQAILRQTQVAGAAGSYYYSNLAQPIWLTSGTQYTLQLYQGATDGYYYQVSSQINPNLTYYDMRYCNACTQSTFPTTILTTYHYGYPDFYFYTRNSVSPAPTIAPGGSGGVGFATQPASIYPCTGGTASINATIAGTATTMQWQVLVGTTWTNLTNTPPYSGVNTATLTISNITTAMNGFQYRLQVTSICGTGTSNPASITISSPPTPSVSSSSPLRFCEGGAAVLNTYQAAGLTYQWLRDGTPIPGANGTNYVANQTGSYTVTMTNGVGCSGTSAPVQVTVLPLPMPVITKTSPTIMTTGTFATYQWYYNTQPIAGATAQTYTAIMNGPYAVAVTDGNDCRNISSVTYINALGIGTLAVSAADIRVYPNPANDNITIENKGQGTMTDVAILNMLGDKVYEAAVLKNTVTIPVGHLAAGLYMVRIGSNGNSVLKQLEIVR